MPPYPQVNGIYTEYLASRHSVVVAHVWAAWSGGNRHVARILSTFEREFSGRIRIVAVHEEEDGNFAFCENAKILNLPALVFYLRGRRHTTLVGLEDISRSMRLLSDILAVFL